MDILIFDSSGVIESVFRRVILKVPAITYIAEYKRVEGLFPEA